MVMNIPKEMKPCHGRDFIDNYKELNFIGKGSFGSVYRAISLFSGQEVAVKKINRKSIKEKNIGHRVNQEVMIHSSLKKHPSIVELYTFFEDDNYVYLVLELCHNGALKQYLENKKTPFTEDEVRRFMVQIVEGLLYLHSHNIMHRDLTLANLLLTKSMDVKISDFGLSSKLDQADEKHTTMCGTPNYIAPEVIMRKPHGLEVDMWGIGCMMYTLLVGKPPFDAKGVKGTLNRVVGCRYDFPSYLSRKAQSLIRSLLSIKPNDRPKLKDILSHPFMKKNNISNNVSNDRLWLTQTSTDSGMGTLSTNSTDMSRNISAKLHSMHLSPLKEDISGNNCENRSHSYHSINHHQPPSSPVRLKKDSRVLMNHNSTSNPKITAPLLDFNQIRGRMTPQPEKESQQTNSCHYHSSHERVTQNRNDCRSNQNSCCFGEGSIHRSWCEGVKNNYPCNQPVPISNGCSCSHVFPCADACSHVEICKCRLKCQTDGQGTSNSREVEKTLGDVIPPLIADRLKPIRQRTKNAIVSITEDGQVQAEFVRVRGNLEKVYDACKISSDGKEISIYILNNGHGHVLTDPISEVPLTPDSLRFKFTFDTLPSKYWKKYMYAARFVDMFRAKTPKIIFYSRLAKCMLMENSPNADFEACFYNGSKIYKVGDQGLIKIIERDGMSAYTLDSVGGVDALNEDARFLLEHFTESHTMCRFLEDMLVDLEARFHQQCFPVIVGRRPSNSISSPDVSPITNLQSFHGSLVNLQRKSVVRSSSPALVQSSSPAFVQSSSPAFLPSKQPSPLTKPSSSSKSEIDDNLKSCLRSAVIPNVGQLLELSGGKLLLRYFDGTQLTVASNSKVFEFRDSKNCLIRFSLNDDANQVPDEFKKKLSKFNEAIAYISQRWHTNERTAVS